MEQPKNEDNRPIEDISSQEEIRDESKQKKFQIPEDVQLGTAEMVGYNIKNWILKCEDSLKKDPDNENEKEKLEDLKLQKAMFDSPVININRRTKINEENPRETDEKKLKEKRKNFSAEGMSILVDEHFVSRFMKTKREGGIVDDMDEYRSNLLKTDIDKLLTAAKTLQHRLVSEDISAANEIILQENIKKETEAAMVNVRQKIKFESILNAIRDGDIDLYQIREKELTDNELNEFLVGNEHTAGAVQRGVLKLMEKRPDDYLMECKSLMASFKMDDSFFHKDEFQEQAQQIIASLLKEGSSLGYYSEMPEIQKIFGISDEALNSERIQESAREGFLSFLKETNDIDVVLQYDKNFKIPDEFFHSNEAREIVENKIIKLLTFELLENYNYYDDIDSFIGGFRISKEVLRSAKFQNEAKKVVAQNIEKGESGVADLYMKEFGISKDFTESPAIKKLFEKDYLMLLKTNMDKCFEFSKNTQISDKVFCSREAKEIVEDRIVDLLFQHGTLDWESISSLIANFKISKENLKGLNKFHKPSMFAVEKCVKNDEMEKAKEIASVFGIADSFVDNLVEKMK